MESIVSMSLVAGLVAVLAVKASAALKKASNPLVPDSSLTVRNFFDVVTDFLVWLGDMVMGPANRKYIPFAGTVFVFILFMNLLGLIPGFLMPTHSITINIGIALVVFFLYHAWGVREVGAINYLKHFWGPFFWLGFVLFPLEILSNCVRPLSLSLRLYGNMVGDHTVVSMFLDLTNGTFVPVPVAFYALGTVVCTVQAFVFTLLTMVYIRLAVVHEGHHDEHEADEHREGHQAAAHH